MDDIRVPIYLVTGFLESGKTTFLDFTLQQEYFAIDGKTLLILCEEGEEEGRTLAADCGQCGEAGRTRYYSRGGRSMHLCAGIKAGRRTGRCPDPIRTGKRDGRDKADHRRDQTGAVGRHLYRTGRRV